MLLPVRQSGEAVFDDDNRAVDDQTEVERAETHQVTGHAERVHAHRHHQERSEEHTSELQSLMRISYAVFCLKKKNTTLHGEHNSQQLYHIQLNIRMPYHNIKQ